MESSSPGSPNSCFTHVHSDFFLFVCVRARACVCVGDCCGSVAMATVELEAEAATVAEVGAVA